MLKQCFSVFSIFFTLLFHATFTVEIKAQTDNSRDFAERFAMRSAYLISSAEATYQATVGAGTFGSLNELSQAGYIDSALAGGEKYGYVFVLTQTAPTATMPARFYLTATPRSYPKTGRRSFYTDQTGEFRGADKNGATATVSDPLLDDCVFSGVFNNEGCVIRDLRMLHGAQMTYQATAGNGNFGTFTNLFAAGLINSRRASRTNHGYTFVVNYINLTPNFPAFFYFKATPTNYGVTGVRSFYIDINGILRGADKQGAPADENDPPINN